MSHKTFDKHLALELLPQAEANSSELRCQRKVVQGTGTLILTPFQSTIWRFLEKRSIASVNFAPNAQFKALFEGRKRKQVRAKKMIAQD